MKNFKFIDDLPVYNDLFEYFENMVEKNIIEVPIHNQVCINAPVGEEHDYKLGTGSLYINWDKVDPSKISSKEELPKREKIYEEYDFTELCTVFKGTPFEDIYNALSKKFKLGRARIMISNSKSCLSWHTDTSPRLHYPMKTQEGCFMVIEEEIYHLPKNQWTLTNTTRKHTAFNASFNKRVHLVVSILEEYED